MVVLQVLKHFAGATSIHGLAFVVDSRLSIFKRVTWALIFTAAIMWASIQLHFAVTCKLRIKFLKISNQFVASEPPNICDLQNSFFYDSFYSIFCLIKNRANCSKQSAAPSIKLFKACQKYQMYFTESLKKIKAISLKNKPIFNVLVVPMSRIHYEPEWEI
jgi:hypothetical protein